MMVAMPTGVDLLRRRLARLGAAEVAEQREAAQRAATSIAWARGGTGAWRPSPHAGERDGNPPAKLRDGWPPALEGVEVYGLDADGLVRRARLYGARDTVAEEFVRTPGSDRFDTTRLVLGAVHEVGAETRDERGRILAALVVSRAAWQCERYEYGANGRLLSVHVSYDSDDFTDEERPPPPYVHEFVYDAAGELAAIAGRQEDSDRRSAVWRRPRAGKDVDREGEALAGELAAAVAEALRGRDPARVALLYDASTTEGLPPTVFATAADPADWNPAEWRERPLALPAALRDALAQHDLLLRTLERDGGGRVLLNAAARKLTMRLRGSEAAGAGFLGYAVDTQLIDLDANLAAIGVAPAGP